MKRFFSVFLNVLKRVGYYAAYFFAFSFLIVGFSVPTSDAYWSEGVAVHNYMSTSHERFVLKVAKSHTYPSLEKASTIASYLGYKINHYGFAENQFSFAASIADEQTTPFSFIMDDGNLAMPFLCLNSYNAVKLTYVTDFCNLMFETEYSSNQLKINEIYITKMTADKLLKDTDLSYEDLLDTTVKTNQIKGGTSKEVEVKIVDIITSYKESWINYFYGDEVVFGSPSVLSSTSLDNLAVHTIMDDDIYSNGYFLKHYKSLIIDSASCEARYYKIVDGMLVSNEMLNSFVDNTSSMSSSNKIIIGIVCVVLSLLIIAGLVVIKRFIGFTTLEDKISVILYGFAFSISYFVASLIGGFQGFLIIFNPYGAIIALVIAANIVMIVYLLRRKMPRLEV